MAKIRLNIQMEETMKEYCKAKSEELGISISGFINVAVAQYKQQEESLKSINKTYEAMKELEAHILSNKPNNE